MRVLIVDDSVVTRMLLRAVLEAEGYQVKEASNGEQALQILLVYTPDIVTMDVHMPGLDGYETTARILERYALPVVVVTASADPYASATAMRALEAGALAVLEKPSGLGAPDFSERIDELLRTLRSMSQVKIVRRLRKAGEPMRQQSALQLSGLASSRPQLVAIAASAGGPVAIKSILQALSAQQPWALVLVQHIAPGFLQSFCEWLATFAPGPVAVAVDGQTLVPGTLYLAPEGLHLGFSANRSVLFDDGPLEEYVRPSADYLFRSVARQFGKQAIGIQLSGMGKDGAKGMLELSRTGALTIAQEPSTAVVDSMPLAAIEQRAIGKVLPPEGIAALLNALAAQSVSQDA
ncbi:chemotaxis protein CheB [Pseudomonas sp.]|uniref:chemotaxis protein CheB n=1 Tax=Pseudomonas sp. TaxID=306 RepID=UPI003C761AF6